MGRLTSANFSLSSSRISSLMEICPLFSLIIENSEWLTAKNASKNEGGIKKYFDQSCFVVKSNFQQELAVFELIKPY